MENIGYIEIIVSGTKGKLKLIPDTFDIKELTEIIEQAEKLLFPGDRKERPLISYQMEEGFVKNIFKTSFEAVFRFNTLLILVATTPNIDLL